MLERRPRAADLLALTGGALTPLAFAPFDLWPLAILTPALLLLTWQDASPRRAAWRGFLFGVGLFGLGTSWVYVSMERFGGVAPPLAIFLTTLFTLFLALFPAAVGALWAWLKGPRPHATALLALFPALWLLAEWIRGLIFTGFPWLLLGYAHSDTPLAGLFPVTGVYGVSLINVLLSGLIVWALTGGKKRWSQAAALGAVLFLLGAVLDRLPWSRPAGEALEVALVQGNVPQDIKWLPEQRAPTLRRYLELTRSHWDADLVVWPETAVPAFAHQVQDFLHRLDQEARRHRTALLIGLPVMDPRSRRYYNAMLALGDGEGEYRKHHLVPFGEYLPLRGLLGGVLDFFDIPLSDFTPGPEDQPLVRLAGWPVSVSICYEDAFGEELIRQLPEAAFLVNASNDAWFGDSFAPHQHLQIARARSMETRRWMVRATNTGVTALIDPHGRLHARLPQFQVASGGGRLVPRQGTTPYILLGNTPTVFTALVLLALGLWRGRIKSAATPAD